MDVNPPALSCLLFLSTSIKGYTITFPAYIKVTEWDTTKIDESIYSACTCRVLRHFDTVCYLRAGVCSFDRAICCFSNRLGGVFVAIRCFDNKVYSRQEYFNIPFYFLVESTNAISIIPVEDIITPVSILAHPTMRNTWIVATSKLSPLHGGLELEVILSISSKLKMDLLHVRTFDY
jgi:hypothetical protein